MKQTLSLALSLLPFALGRRHMGARESGSLKRFLQRARELSSYLLIALLVPGGSVIALLMWMYRQRNG